MTLEKCDTPETCGICHEHQKPKPCKECLEKKITPPTICLYLVASARSCGAPTVGNTGFCHLHQPTVPLPASALPNHRNTGDLTIRSWRVDAFSPHSGQWVCGPLCFSTEDKAKTWASDLVASGLVQTTRIIPSEREANR